MKWARGLRKNQYKELNELLMNEFGKDLYTKKKIDIKR